VNTLTDSIPALGRRDYEVRDASAPMQVCSPRRLETNAKPSRVP